MPGRPIWIKIKSLTPGPQSRQKAAECQAYLENIPEKFFGLLRSADSYLVWGGRAGLPTTAL